MSKHSTLPVIRKDLESNSPGTTTNNIATQDALPVVEHGHGATTMPPSDQIDLSAMQYDQGAEAFLPLWQQVDIDNVLNESAFLTGDILDSYTFGPDVGQHMDTLDMHVN